MKNILRTALIGVFFVLGLAAPLTVVATPQSAHASADCEKRVLGIPPWYRGLTGSAPDCNIVSPDDPRIGGIGNFIWRIVLNVIEMALVAAVYVTAFFIIYGGFLYMTGGAMPGQLEKGRKTLINAVVGMVICLGAVGLTNLVFSIIT